MKTFTGNKDHYILCREHLKSLGYSVSDAIHIGENRFEFGEGHEFRLGCRDIHKILCWIDEVGEIKYKAKVVGWMCGD